MKKTWALLFVFTCIPAAFSGCGDTVPSESDTADKTTATATTEAYFEDPVTYSTFDNYADFSAAMAEQYPHVPLYTPPENAAASWTWENMVIDTTYYSYSFYDTERQRSVFLEIGTTTQYNDVQEQLDELSQYTMGNPFDVIEQESDYYIACYPQDEQYTLYGIMPESKTDYTLMIWNDDGSLDTKGDLLALREALGL
ncbi:hypothetical protein [Ruminococcus sp.]|uniref:hypothetical protein n=1 Tax=Ruminococcus sp. TaxID=41978 RepID=UPI0025D84557|nr:hypothetical protein [Ruminococcus sp.]